MEYGNNGLPFIGHFFFPGCRRFSTRPSSISTHAWRSHIRELYTLPKLPRRVLTISLTFYIKIENPSFPYDTIASEERNLPAQVETKYCS